MTYHFPPEATGTLDPDELRLAADVYEAALAAIGRPIPEPFRELLARFVIERVLEGEREADLRASALDYVKLVFRKSE